VKRLRSAFAERVSDTLNTMTEHLKFIDESGTHLGLTRLFGRASPGTRVVEATPGYSGAHYTVIAALGWDGITAPWLLEGAMDGVCFETYVQQVLVPTLCPGDRVLIDNLSVHKGERIRTRIEGCGAHLEFLPPYSSDLNPIELCWSKVKAALRTAKARTFDELVNALCDAFQKINPTDAVAWFAHCGYAISP
jgi:transposase